MPIKNLNQFSIWIAHILRYLWLTLLFYYYNAPSESVCELSSYRVSELSLFAARIFEMDGDIRGFARFMFLRPPPRATRLLPTWWPKPGDCNYQLIRTTN